MRRYSLEEHLLTYLRYLLTLLTYLQSTCWTVMLCNEETLTKMRLEICCLYQLFEFAVCWVQILRQIQLSQDAERNRF